MKATSPATYWLSPRASWFQTSTMAMQHDLWQLPTRFQLPVCVLPGAAAAPVWSAIAATPSAPRSPLAQQESSSDPTAQAAGSQAPSGAVTDVLLVANVAGYAFDLYAMFWWFDRILHAATIFALTLWLAPIICTPAFRADQPLLVAALVACMDVAIGAWWEVAEWVFDLLAPKDVIKGKDDTVIDIVMDTFGACLAAALTLRFMRRDGTT